MSKYWKLYCNTEAIWKPSWSDTAPTVCPTNAGHTINTDSIASNSNITPFLRISGISAINKNSSYTVVGRFLWSGTTLCGNILKITAISSMDATTTDYSIRIVDVTNGQIIATATFVNTTTAICNLGTISNIPANECIIEIQTKRTTATSTKANYVDEILIYTDINS